MFNGSFLLDVSDRSAMARETGRLVEGVRTQGQASCYTCNRVKCG
jgi:hypothetical protein